jgi:hypothetical protein
MVRAIDTLRGKQSVSQIGGAPPISALTMRSVCIHSEHFLVLNFCQQSAPEVGLSG